MVQVRLLVAKLEVIGQKLLTWLAAKNLSWMIVPKFSDFFTSDPEWYAWTKLWIERHYQLQLSRTVFNRDAVQSSSICPIVFLSLEVTFGTETENIPKPEGNVAAAALKSLLIRSL